MEKSYVAAEKGVKAVVEESGTAKERLVAEDELQTLANYEEGVKESEMATKPD